MTLHIEATPKQVSISLAKWIAIEIRELLKRETMFTWALSGGNSPERLYELMAAAPYREEVSWKKLHIFFGDERVVPFNDVRNNGRMAYEALLKHVLVPAEKIHFIQTEISPQESSAEYENLLHQYFDQLQYTFDLTLLGMGEDGHTLSLFPYSEILHERHALVKSFCHPSEKIHRITLTPPVVNRSRKIVFLVTGKEKAKALSEVITGKNDPEKFPAQLIQPLPGEMHWFLDEEAASLL